MNRKNQIKNLDYMKPFRRALRKRLTPAEASLWSLLKNRQAFGLKFRRQFSIKNFVVDFFCAETKMIIELDGEPHFTQAQADKDQKRDKRLSELGYKVFRYENLVVFDHPDFIFDDIESLLEPPPAEADPF
ncbi:MAG: endonuclease domain-containing protein [Bacteroidetes bacterium]|nr:endonuclease domain-containing protein [Bacteroidota bacterium]